MKRLSILNLFILSIVQLFISSHGLSQTIQKILEIPEAYTSTNVTDKAWVVYSDKNNNQTYKNPAKAAPLKQMDFMERFYVTKIDKKSNFVELIKYAPSIVDSTNLKIINPSKVEYYGWISADDLILSQKAFDNKSNGIVLKWITILNNKKIFKDIEKHSESGLIKLYDGPDLKKTRSVILGFNELVYVYKSSGNQKDSSANKYLIGKRTFLSPQNSGDNILGWIPANFIQLWGQRLCVDPFSTSAFAPANQPIIYTTKEACISGKTTGNYNMSIPPCDQKQLWKGYPILKIEEIKRNNSPYTMLHTGTIASIFDKSDSFIYNTADRTKITYSTFCDMYEASTHVNVAIAINVGTDKKKYLPALTHLVQELPVYFDHNKKANITYQFAAIDCSSSSNKLEFTNQCGNLLPVFASIIQKNNESKNSATNYGIGNTVVIANNLFKEHEDETNIIIVISSKPDVDSRYLKESLFDELAQKNVRFVFLQPYSEDEAPYSNFVTQAQSIIKNTSPRGTGYKINKLAAVAGVIDPMTSTAATAVSLKEGVNNILYAPTDVNTEGYIIYPDQDSTITTKTLQSAMYSFFDQIQTDNDQLQTTLRKMFNSSLCNNNKIDNTFKQFYASLDTVPSGLSSDLNNMDYNYFINGYTIFPKSTKPFKYSLLLSPEEYQDILSMFKFLNLDQLHQQMGSNTLTLFYQQLSKLLVQYKTRNHITNYIDNMTFSEYFYMLFGSYSDNELLTKYKIYELNNSLHYADLRSIFEYIYTKYTLFSTLSNNPNYLFTSNGSSYYRIPEDYLP